MLTALYNENDAFACAWLSNLMDANLITPGDIDDRSIEELTPKDIADYERVHFFAGIGGWDYALNLTNWHGPVWTGSCPCQPFSGAGQRKAHADKRHLWPAFYNLINLSKPPTIFGEQVASGDGPEWVAGVRADLEAIRYEVGVASLCAPAVAAPHPRRRFYWVAQSQRDGTQRGAGTDSGQSAAPTRTRRKGRHSDNAISARKVSRQGLGIGIGLERPERESQAREASSTPWAASEFITCPDGLRRVPTEPALFPLADGIPNRVGIVRGSGNAIVPQLAAKFITAFMECQPMTPPSKGPTE